MPIFNGSECILHIKKSATSEFQMMANEQIIIIIIMPLFSVSRAIWPANVEIRMLDLKDLGSCPGIRKQVMLTSVLHSYLEH